MFIFAYKVPNIVKARKDRDLPWLRAYTEDFELEGDMLFALSLSGRNPLMDAFCDYSFNEPEEYNLFKERYGQLDINTIKYTINPKFE